MCGGLGMHHCFFNGLAQRCCSGRRIERDETAFFGGGEHGSQLHARLQDDSVLPLSRDSYV